MEGRMLGSFFSPSMEQKQKLLSSLGCLLACTAVTPEVRVDHQGLECLVGVVSTCDVAAAAAAAPAIQ